MRGLTQTLSRAAGREAGLAPPVAGLKALTTGLGGTYRTIFTFNGLQVAVTDLLAYSSRKIFDFAPGKIRMKGGTARLAFAVLTPRASTINDSAALDWSVGTAAASSATLASTMADVIAKQDKLLDGVGTAFTGAQAVDAAAAATFDGTVTPVDLHLNLGFPTATDIDGDGVIVVSGTVTLLWEAWGDNV